MADKKISQLPATTTLADTDLATVVQSGVNKKIEFLDVQKSIDHENIANIGSNTHAQIDSHIANTSNPHSVTKAQVGLGNVDNTSDINKPVSSAQAAADTAVQNYSVQRSNHTGTQTASTISDFNAAASSAAPVQSVFSRSGNVTSQNGDYTASQIGNVPSGNIIATDLQSAIDELDAEKASVSDNRFFTQNELKVKLNPGTGEFSSVTAALASITTNSVTNRFSIYVGPGIYTENPFTMKPYVSLVGESPEATVIQSSNPNSNFITLVNNCYLSGFTIAGATGSGYAAVFFQDAAEDLVTLAAFLVNVKFGSNNIQIKVDSTTKVTSIYASNCRFGGLGVYDKAAVATSSSGKTSRITLRDCTTTGSTAPVPTIFGDASGVGAEISYVSCSFRVSLSSPSGIGIRVANGALTRLLGSRLTGFATAIQSVAGGSAPTIKATGIELNTNTVDIQIDNTGTLGSYRGEYDPQKIFLNSSAPFYIQNKDLNIVTVAKRGGDFTSVKSAVDSIVTASPTNPYVVRVGPGFYIEDTITGKPNISIIGESADAVTIEVNATSKNVIVGNNSFTIKNLTLQGATDSGKYAVFYSPTGSGAGMTIQDVTFGNNYGYVSLLNSSFDLAVITIINANTTTLSAPTIAFACESTTTAPTIALIQDFAASFLSPIQDFGFVTGPGSFLVVTNISAQALSGGRFLRAADGARIVGRQTAQEFFTTGLEVENVGSAPSIQITGAIFDSTVNDVLVSHPGTTGAIQGLADSAKITINPASPIRLDYTDATGVETGSVVLGELKQGDRHDRLLSISKLSRQTSPTGAYTGGVLSDGGGLDINVTSGSGFLIDSVDYFMKEVSWSAATLTISNNTTKYIYVDGTGAILTSTSEPTVTNNIVLGRVSTVASAIHFIDKSAFRSNQLGTRIEQYQREAIGPIYSVGSIVSENGTRGLDVASGVYYFGNTRFAPSGGTGISWDSHYRNGTGGYNHTSQSVVDNGFYDNNSGTLVAMTAGYYAKHSLYIIGDGADEKYSLVYSQAEYSALSLAQQGNIPLPPPEFIDGVTLIATIIVHQGSANIVEIRDERPIIGFKASGVSAATFHGNLLGLLADDHPQYLPINGIRAMAGSLDMGGNQIINVGNVDGVDVSAHAGRHSFTGADPLLSAVPQTIGASNLEGTDNTHISRADHVHAHGNLGGGSTHAAVTTSVNGYMSAADKVKLDTISSGAIARVIQSVSTPTTAGAAASTDYVYNVSGTTTITLPTAVGNTNSYKIKNDGTGTVTVVFTAGQNADGSTSIMLTPNAALEFISNNSNYRIF